MQVNERSNLKYSYSPIELVDGAHISDITTIQTFSDEVDLTNGEKSLNYNKNKKVSLMQ